MGYINDFKKLKNYLLLWLGQSTSALGSTMTGFALSIWAYERTGNALTLSISGLALMLPKMACGLLVGPLVDKLDKKSVMIFTDLGMGLCSLALFVLLWSNSLEIWHIYCINLISGVIGGISSPANDVAVTMIVPKELYIKANGLRSAASGIVEMFSPVFAAVMLSFAGMPGVVIFDFSTMVFAVITLAAFVKIPKPPKVHTDTQFKKASQDKTKKISSIKMAANNYLHELSSGFAVIKSSRLLFTLMLYFAFINLVAGITYFNLITPMILARSGGDTNTLGLCNSAIGLGGIVGGLLATLLPPPKSKIKTIFAYMTLSFILGDTLFAIGSSAQLWIAAGFLSSVFIPVITANNIYFWRVLIPVELQGRAFAFKYAIQSGMVPVGMILGGFLADYLFEPFMEQKNFLTPVLGNGVGSGMAFMFLITGILGTTLSILGFFNRALRKAEEQGAD